MKNTLRYAFLPAMIGYRYTLSYVGNATDCRKKKEPSEAVVSNPHRLHTVWSQRSPYSSLSDYEVETNDFLLHPKLLLLSRLHPSEVTQTSMQTETCPRLLQPVLFSRLKAYTNTGDLLVQLNKLFGTNVLISYGGLGRNTPGMFLESTSGMICLTPLSNWRLRTI